MLLVATQISKDDSLIVLAFIADTASCSTAASGAI